MKKYSTFRYVLFILLGTLLLSGGITAVQSAAALAVTNIHNTPTQVNVPSDTPGDSLIPGLPMPSRIEFPVQNERLEAKVAGLEKPSQVHLGDGLVFLPGYGNLFLGLGIRVSDLTGSDVMLKWSDVYLINKYQDKFYPMWGAYQKTNAVMNPLTINILPLEIDPEIDPDAHVYLGDNGYLRVIFRLPQDNLYYYLGVADLPLIEIDYRRH